VALFAGGCVRLLSILTVGAPHAVYLWLMGGELVLPLVMVAWQAAVAGRRSGLRNGFR
jgi:hypothetical protein